MIIVNPKTVTFSGLEVDAIIQALHAREDDLVRRIARAVKKERLQAELDRVQDCICRLS